MIEFKTNLGSIGTSPYDSVERAIGYSYKWRRHFGYNKLSVALIKSRAKGLGIKLTINQRYNKKWYLRTVKFQTDEDYTMFLLKWTT